MSRSILFCGDPHGRFEQVIQQVRLQKPSAVILLGDQESPVPLDEVLAPILELTDIWWLPGNHDTDCVEHYDHLFGSQLADRNLHGRVAEIAGIRVAGLGGVFRGKVWAPPAEPLFESSEDLLARCGRGNRWRGGLPLRHRSTIFPADFYRLFGQTADVFVSHEAPSTHRRGWPLLDELITQLGVRVALHGHLHEHYTAKLGRTTIMGVDLCETVLLALP